MTRYSKTMSEALQEVSERASAKRDAMKAMGKNKGIDPADVDTDATDDDVKAASKNIIMQLRKSVSMRGNHNVEFASGKQKVDAKIAQAVQDKFNKIKRPADKQDFQNKIAKSYKDLLIALKEQYEMVEVKEEYVCEDCGCEQGNADPKCDCPNDSTDLQASYWVKKESVDEEVDLDEMKEPFVVVDTANGNKVVATASDEKGAKSSIASAELPPMKIKDKKTLKIMKSKKKQMIGRPFKEEIEEKLKIPNMKTIKLKNGAKVLDKIYTNRTQADNAASSLMKQHKGAKADAYQSPFSSKFYVRIKEALDKEDEPKVKEIIKKLKGASKAHAGQASDLEKSIKEDGHMDVPSSIRMCKTISEDASQIEQSLSSRSDENLDTWWTNKLAVASNSMNKLRDYITTPVEEGRKSRYGVTPSKKRYDPDSGEIHDDESANKHIIMQMRKSVDLKGNFKVEFEDGKKQKVPLDIARAVSNKYNMIKRPAEKEKFQKAAGKSYKDLLKALKEK